MAINVKVGDKAPDFELPNAGRKQVRLADFLGRKLVLYFYPEDDTPGCNAEACAFRDDLAKYKRAGYEIIGISPDTMAAHNKFAGKFRLNFILLCDINHVVMEKYGVWGEKERMDLRYQGVLRTTFLIDQNGIITHIFEKVKPEGHSKEILAAIDVAGGKRT